MSAPDEKLMNESAGTLPDISLGSLADGSPSTPGPSRHGSSLRPRLKTDPTRSPISVRRSLASGEDPDEPDEKEEPATPIVSKATARVNNSKGAANLTLREQEKVIDLLKRENFSLKLTVHFLEERLKQVAPEHVEAAFKQNINLKIEVQSRGVELKKYKKLLLELEKELQAAQKGAGGSKARERDLEEALAEREREIRELRRRRAVGPEDGALREAEAHNAELEEQLENVKAIMEENMHEIECLKDELLQKGGVSMVSDGGESRQARLERKLAEAEDEIEDLRTQHDEDLQLISHRESEKEMLEDEIERLKLALEDLERRREAESYERSESRTQLIEERDERDALEAELNGVRDQLAATTIELQQREDDLELKCREIDDLIMEHEHDLDEAGAAWRDELEDLRGRNDQLRDMITENDAELRELRGQLEEQDNLIRRLEDAVDLKEEEVRAANQDIEKLSQQVWNLEDELDHLKEDMERIKEEAAVDRESAEAVANALKEKLAVTKSQLQESTALQEQYRQDIVTHRARQEELGQHSEALAAELKSEQDARAQLENELDALERHREDDARRHKRLLGEKESEIRATLDNLTRQKTLLAERDADLQKLQAAVQNMENETRRAGETHVNDKFALELELDRLKRDLSRTEDDLTRARAELADREAQYREREAQLDRLHSSNRDLAAEVATQTQARLNATEKLDAVQVNLKAAEGELGTLKIRVNELESRLSKDQRALLTNESQFRDQLTERNTLLLTIYQYTEKILGVDKTLKKSGSETKPFTNFSVFHDNLISKLKALSQIQLDFDKRVKQTEANITEQYQGVKKRLENYSKQIDNFEKMIKSALENKHSWRRKYMAKEGELEALKATNATLTSQLASVKASPTSKDAELRAATAKFVNAERRMVNCQNQLATAEETNAHLMEKHLAAEQKWEARVKEYENRLKTAEEKVKRERQGAKERIAELENHVKTLHKQIEQAKRHGAQLSEIVENHKNVQDKS